MKLLATIFLICVTHFCWAVDINPLTLQHVTANYGPGCNIAATIPFSSNGGMGSDYDTGLGGLAVQPIPKYWQSSIKSLGFSISCLPASMPSVSDGMARWNEKSLLWEKNLDNWFMPPPPSADERKVRDKATRILNIKAVNARGYVGIFEEISGDERFRERILSFCLFNPPKAVCGDGVVGLLREDRKGDLTQQALKIISSIEFLPDSPEVNQSNEKSEPTTDGSSVD